MIEVSGGQDQLLDMFDKLQVVNLSTEGSALLESMADLIRCALEKGLLLEQNILKERNKKLESNSKNKSPIKETKKKSKARKSSLNDNLPEETNKKDLICTYNTELNPFLSVNQTTLAAMINVQDANALNSNKLGSSENNLSASSSISESKIKLINPSLLFNKDLNSVVSGTKNASKPFISLNPNTPSFCSPPGFNLTNNLTTFNRSQSSIPLSNQDNSSFCVNSVTNSVHNQIASLKSTEYCGFVAKEEPQDSGFEKEVYSTNFPSQNCLNVGTNVATAQNNQQVLNHSTPIEPLQKMFDPPVMPTPIFIKCEPKREDKGAEPDQFIPLNIELNLTHQARNNLGDEEDSSLSEMGHRDPSAVHMPLNWDSELHKVFIAASKDATEEEVKQVFVQNDLVVRSIKLINKPSHSFGFICFLNEQDMKNALSLNRQLTVGGQQMVIRPCFDKRAKHISSYQKKENGPPSKQKLSNSFGESVSKKQKLSAKSSCELSEEPSSLNSSFLEKSSGSSNACDNSLTNESDSFSGSYHRMDEGRERRSSFSEFSPGKGYQRSSTNSNRSFRHHNRRRGGRSHVINRQRRASYNDASDTNHESSTSSVAHERRPFSDHPREKRDINQSHESNISSNQREGYRPNQQKLDNRQKYDQRYRSKYRISNQRRGGASNRNFRRTY